MGVQLTINGISEDRYLFNNPIWLDITGFGASAKYVNVVVTRNDNQKQVESRMYIFGTSVSFDVSEHIKGLCDYPNYPDGVILDGQDLETNYYNFTILVQSYNNDGSLDGTNTKVKTFIRGGFETQNTNIAIPDNTVLKESVRVPNWNGYENIISRLLNNKIVADSNAGQEVELENLFVVGCDPLHVRFMNMLGGYSYWLFENWEVTKSTEKTEVIKRRSKDISTGHKTSYKLSVESRVDRRYFKLMRALIQSPEVAVYGLSTKMDIVSDIQTEPRWETVWNRGNSMPLNSFQKLRSVKLNFEYILRLKTETIW